MSNDKKVYNEVAPGTYSVKEYAALAGVTVGSILYRINNNSLPASTSHTRIGHSYAITVLDKRKRAKK